MVTLRYFFNFLNLKGIRRRGAKVFHSSGSSKKFIFRKNRFKSTVSKSRSRRLFRLSRFPRRLRSLRKRFFRFRRLRRKKPKIRRPRLLGRIIRMRYASDSRFFSKKLPFRKKKGYINTRALLTGESSIFRPSLKPSPYSSVQHYKISSYMQSLYRSSKKTFFRYKKVFFNKLSPNEVLGYRPFSLRAVRIFLRSFFLHISKTYLAKFKFYTKFIKRSRASVKFFKRFGLFEKPKTFKKFNASSRTVFPPLRSSNFSEGIAFQLLIGLKKFIKCFAKFSYSFFIRRSYIAEKNKSFFEKFRFKLSTYLALHQSLTLTYYRHFFLNNSFFIRFIPTNSNFFINFGFYDKVIFQISAGYPIFGFTNSRRSTIPAVINLVRYFIVRLNAFVRHLFPMIFHSSYSTSRVLRRRRLKIPVYYIMEKGIDKRVKIAFKKMMIKSFWRVIGIRFYVPLPHGHTLRVSKRRRR